MGGEIGSALSPAPAHEQPQAAGADNQKQTAYAPQAARAAGAGDGRVLDNLNADIRAVAAGADHRRFLL
ncbi:hypothetical protein SDC9_179837 [bioreactor metagenome]|uniref:Uncharacterized protein n=1 Tax=bioreactor metagenome TaxID=1076179 RepID=A0A645H2Y5_9ZZZZ